KQLAEFPNSAKAEEWRRRLAEQEAAAETAGAELEAYRERLKAVNDEMGKRSSGTAGGDSPDLTPPADPAADKAEATRLKAIRDRIAALELEADTLGMTETELELYKLQLAGASDEQIRAAATSLGLIDAYEMQTKAA